MMSRDVEYPSVAVVFLVNGIALMPLLRAYAMSPIRARVQHEAVGGGGKPPEVGRVIVHELPHYPRMALDHCLAGGKAARRRRSKLYGENTRSRRPSTVRPTAYRAPGGGQSVRMSPRTVAVNGSLLIAAKTFM
jgi:hypothetical protein